MNSTSERPLEALAAIGAVVVLLALLLILNKPGDSTERQSASASGVKPAVVASDEN